MAAKKKKSKPKKIIKPYKHKHFSILAKSQRDHPTPLTFDGFTPYTIDERINKTALGDKTKTIISHASGPIPNNAKVIGMASLNPDIEYDENVVNNWQPHMNLSVADNRGKALSAAQVDGLRDQNKNYVPHYFLNPMQDLDYLVIQAIARSTFVGPLMEAVTKFEVGTGFVPELELINPAKDEDKNEKLIEENQDVIDTLLGIDEQVNIASDNDANHELDVPLIDKVAALITTKNLFNRSALIFGYDKPIKINGRVYKEIPSSLKFAHPRDLGIIQVNPATWRMQSVQWRNAYYMVPTKDMIYMWNPWVSAKTRNAWFYGDSLVIPMLDAGRVVRKNIGVNFNAMSEATWSGLFLMAVRPQGQDLTEKQKEYKQVTDNMVRGGPNVLLEAPENVAFHNVDFNPKVTEFKDLTEAMLRYMVACVGLPHSMFYDESASNRATMIGKIQLATATTINPMRESDGRMFSAQWYQRWFRLVYKEKKADLLKKFRIKMTFKDLRIAEWFDKVAAANEVDGRKQLKDEEYGQLVGIENYTAKVDPDAETMPGGSEGMGMSDGKTSLTLKKDSKTVSPGSGFSGKEKKS